MQYTCILWYGDVPFLRVVGLIMGLIFGYLCLLIFGEYLQNDRNNKYFFAEFGPMFSSNRWNYNIRNCLIMYTIFSSKMARPR